MRSKKIRNAKNKGFSLMEVLIALALMALILLPLAKNMITGSRMNSKSKEISISSDLSNSVINTMQSSSLEKLMIEANGYDVDSTGNKIQKNFTEALLGNYEHNGMSEMKKIVKGSQVQYLRLDQNYEENNESSPMRSIYVPSYNAEGKPTRAYFVGQPKEEYAFFINGVHDETKSLNVDVLGTIEAKQSAEIATLTSINNTNVCLIQQMYDTNSIYEELARETKKDIETIKRNTRQRIEIYITGKTDSSVVEVKVDAVYTYYQGNKVIAQVQRHIGDSKYNGVGDDFEGIYLMFKPLQTGSGNYDEFVITNKKDIRTPLYLIPEGYWDNNINENPSYKGYKPAYSLTESNIAEKANITICTPFDPAKAQKMVGSKDLVFNDLSNTKEKETVYELTIKVYKHRAKSYAANIFLPREEDLLSTSVGTFIDTSDRYIFAENRKDVEDTTAIGTAVVTKKDFIYDGNEKTGVVGNKYVILKGTTKGTAAGTYTAYAIPTLGSKWADGTSGRRTYTWHISNQNIEIDKDIKANEIYYNGEVQSVFIANDLREKTNIKGVTQAKDAGTYEIVLSLKDNFTWKDGTRDDAIISWTIKPRPIEFLWEGSSETFLQYNGGKPYNTLDYVKVYGVIGNDDVQLVALNNEIGEVGSVITEIIDVNNNNYIIKDDANCKHKFTILSSESEEISYRKTLEYNEEEQYFVNIYAFADQVDFRGEISGKDVGEYVFYATLKDGNTWRDGTTGQKEFHAYITPQPIYIEWVQNQNVINDLKDGMSWTYDGKVHNAEFRVRGTRGDNKVLDYKPNSVVDTKNMTIQETGTNTAVILKSNDPNYTLKKTECNMRIYPRKVAVNTYNYIYDGKPHQGIKLSIYDHYSHPLQDHIKEEREQIEFIGNYFGTNCNHSKTAEFTRSTVYAPYKCQVELKSNNFVWADNTKDKTKGFNWWMFPQRIQLMNGDGLDNRDVVFNYSSADKQWINNPKTTCVLSGSDVDFVGNSRLVIKLSQAKKHSAFMLPNENYTWNDDNRIQNANDNDSRSMVEYIVDAKEYKCEVKHNVTKVARPYVEGPIYYDGEVKHLTAYDQTEEDLINIKKFSQALLSAFEKEFNNADGIGYWVKKPVNENANDPVTGEPIQVTTNKFVKVNPSESLDYEHNSKVIAFYKRGKDVWHETLYFYNGVDKTMTRVVLTSPEGHKTDPNMWIEKISKEPLKPNSYRTVTTGMGSFAVAKRRTFGQNGFLMEVSVNGGASVIADKFIKTDLQMNASSLVNKGGTFDLVTLPDDPVKNTTPNDPSDQNVQAYADSLANTMLEQELRMANMGIVQQHYSYQNNDKNLVQCNAVQFYGYANGKISVTTYLIKSENGINTTYRHVGNPRNNQTGSQKYYPTPLNRNDCDTFSRNGTVISKHIDNIYVQNEGHGQNRKIICMVNVSNNVAGALGRAEVPNTNYVNIYDKCPTEINIPNSSFDKISVSIPKDTIVDNDNPSGQIQRPEFKKGLLDWNENYKIVLLPDGAIPDPNVVYSTTETRAGKYVAYAVLNPHKTWTDGSTAPHKIDWEIKPMVLKARGSTEIYNGEYQTPNIIVEVDRAAMANNKGRANVGGGTGYDVMVQTFNKVKDQLVYDGLPKMKYAGTFPKFTVSLNKYTDVNKDYAFNNAVLVNNATIDKKIVNIDPKTYIFNYGEADPQMLKIAVEAALNRNPVNTDQICISDRSKVKFILSPKNTFPKIGQTANMNVILAPTYSSDPENNARINSYIINGQIKVKIESFPDQGMYFKTVSVDNPQTYYAPGKQCTEAIPKNEIEATSYTPKHRDAYVTMAGSEYEYEYRYKQYFNGKVWVDNLNGGWGVKAIKNKQHYNALSDTVLSKGDQLTDVRYTYYGTGFRSIAGNTLPSSVRNTNYAFAHSSVSETINFNNLTNLKDMSGMYSGCSSLKSVNGTINRSVNYMRESFNNCYNLTGYIDIDADIAQEEHLNRCFASCAQTSNKTIRLSGETNKKYELKATGTEVNKVKGKYILIDFAGSTDVANGTVPTGCVYKSANNSGSTIKFTTIREKESFPAVNDNDELITPTYRYVYHADPGGWQVLLVQPEKHNELTNDSFGEPIYKTINNANTLWMIGTFEGCTNLNKVISIPDTVIDISQAFKNCSSLRTMPTIPQNVRSLREAFINCTNLTGKGLIETSSINNYGYAFYNTGKLVLQGQSHTENVLKILAKTDNGENDLKDPNSYDQYHKVTYKVIY